ncbi:MAG: hypothetical protein JOZ96_16880 [Acidobacteria bacterium]|nr:hypothetical protein [Acidobacteriota bacterium]
MDWKNKQFEREAVFQAERELVSEAARSFAAESLAGWQITETPDGFEARGDSASHAATAKFRIEPAPFGTKVAVKLLVERAGPLGFMLFDVGGYYDGQLRKWLEGIQWHLHQRLTSTNGQEAAGQGEPTIHKATGTKSLYVGCMIALFVLPFVIFCICAVVGLLTGNLYLVGRRGETIHGPLARILSGAFLTIVVLIGLRMLKMRKRARYQN